MITIEILFRFAQTDFTGRIAGYYLIRFYILRDNRLSSNDSILADRYAGHYHRPYSHECTIFDCNLLGNQLKRGTVEIVSARTKVGFLSNGGAFHNLYCSEGVGIRSFSETCTVMHDQMPRHLNPGFWMDEWSA